MAKYEKDEINFHVFLNMMRQIHNVTLDDLSEGLYTKSAMKRIEIGERIPEKLTRDRLMARMGVSGENYEDYLQNDEFDRWKLRQEILNCVERKQWDILEEKLNEYQNLRNISKVEEQFLITMQLWLLKSQNMEIELQRQLIEKAVFLTVPQTDKGFSDKMLLADQEIELLIEYIELRKCDKNIEEEVEWRLNQYQAILHYVMNSQMDDIGRVKIYPKVAVCFCKLILEKARTTKNVYRGIPICNHAIELLQNTRKLYYFVELLEIKAQFFEFVMHDLMGQGKPEKAELLLPVFDKIMNWKREMTNLYIEYDISPYMEHDCHVFREPKCNAISDVIKKRRKMMGLSREELCDGICSERTLMRIETKKLPKMQMPIIRELFERLGLCAEYTRARVITSDFKAIKLAEDLAKYTNNAEVEKWEENLEKLEESLCMNISCNKQIIRFNRCSLELVKKNITQDEYFEQMKDALECTLQLKHILDSDNCYMTQEEVSCVYNIGVRLYDRNNPFIPILNEVCEQYVRDNIVSTKIGEYELLMTGMANYLGTMGQFDESDSMSSKAMKNGLQNRRMSALATNIYNQLWNFQQREKRKLPLSHKCDEEIEFHRCIMLANISKQYNREKFYTMMLNEWKEASVSLQP